MTSRRTAEPTIVLDCRWLSTGGPGRTTELLLRGLAEAAPTGRWLLWGPPAAADHAWPGARLVPTSTDPRRWLGQRHCFDMPRGDLVVFLHQERPLRAVPAVTLVYDTIPVRYGAGGLGRKARHLFLRHVARTSKAVLTISQHSKRSIVRDLGVPATKVKVLRFPFDAAAVDRVTTLRAAAARSPVALYVGNFRPHKNLPRLIEAFDRTTFRREGGRLLLVGGWTAEADRLSRALDARQRTFVEVRAACDQADLDRLFAEALFVVQPSLEEGFGLPAWEALCYGLPVALSSGGALAEIADGFATPFDPTSVEAIAQEIDATAQRAGDGYDGAAVSRALRDRSPSLADFAREFVAAVRAELPA